MIAIKRLADAQRDGDPIHAVIIGSGVNQDGRTNGITVPNPDAQVSLIERVCTEAGITPGSLQYVEAHGTSTPVGDPLEANALARALAIGREPGAETYVGSVKTNIGHTEAAAGVAGLIKTVLSLKHRIIPPHINLETVNPQVDEASLPYRIPREPTAWPAHSGPARAGVNSFGFGGTNAHVLLQEAPPVPEPAETAETAEPAERDGYHVLPLTARDPQAFAAQAAGLRERLATGTRLTDAAYTLAHRRQHLDQRLSLVYDSPRRWTRCWPPSPAARATRTPCPAPSARAWSAAWCGCSPAWVRSGGPWAASCTRPSPSTARSSTAATGRSPP